MAISLFTTSAFAQLQEVRGVETRRIIYDGPLYDKYRGGTSTKYFGFEFKNTNSISVSVDIILYYNTNDETYILTKKSFTLKPNEKYILKREENSDFQAEGSYDADWRINKYYVEYKAYKLQ